MKVTKDFYWKEFESRDGATMPATVKKNITLLAQSLQALRDKIGKPILINSGYRSPSHNKRIGGVPNSQHTLGKAADIKVHGLSPKQVAEEIEKLIKAGKMKEGAIGVYSTFVHYDIRGLRVRFKGKY